MSYELLLLTNRPSLVVVLPKSDFLETFRPPKELRGMVTEYLGKRAPWETESGRTGFNGCGVLRQSKTSSSITFRLSRDTLEETLLSLSFLFVHLEQAEINGDLLSPRPVCRPGCHYLSGRVSREFRDVLPRLTSGDQKAVIRSMQSVFRAVAPPTASRFASECDLLIYAKEQRFVLTCFGDACDVAIYPDNATPSTGGYTHFSCHNLDSGFQQATLLAGLVSLSSQIRHKL